MPDLVRGICQWLSDRGLGLYSATDESADLFPDQMAGDRDHLVAVIGYPGRPSHAVGWGMPSFQVQVRGDRDSTEPSRLRALRLREALNGLGMERLPDGTLLQSCWGGDVEYLGPDDSGRHQHAISFETVVSWPRQTVA